MIKIGALVRHKYNKDKIGQITALWDKRDIDYECPESVAIIPMVRIIYLNEDQMGQQGSVSRRGFHTNWEVINES